MKQRKNWVGQLIYSHGVECAHGVRRLGCMEKTLLDELSQRLIGSCFVRDALRRPHDALHGIDRCHNRKACGFPHST